MVDLRYFLISTVAVFLALGIGIVMGSGVLGGPLLENLERRADAAIARSDALEEEINLLDDRIDELSEFAAEAEAPLVDGALNGDRVVVVEMDGSDGDVVDGIDSVIDQAGGTVASRITISERFGLPDPEAAAELAAVLGSSTSDPGELRVEAAQVLGSRLSAAAALNPARRDGPAAVKADRVINDLQGSGYVTADRLEEAPTIPPGAAFVIAGGTRDSAPFPPAAFVTALGMRLADHGTNVVLAETSESSWNLVQSVREDDEVSRLISTVDNAETVVGRVAVALELGRSKTSGTQHLGFGEGAGAVIPVETSSG